MTLLAGGLCLAGSAMAGESPAAGKKPLPPPPAPDSLLGFTLSAGYDTHYLFHGFNVGENLLWEKLEFSLPVTDKLTLTAGQWYGHLFDYTYNELDLYGGLTYNAGPVNLSAGFTWYHYFDGSTLENQYEPYVTVSTNGLPVDFYASYFYDFEVDGTYLEAGLSKTIALNDSISLVPAVILGYNLDYNTPEEGLNHVQVRLGAPIALTKTATLTPYIAGNFALDATDGYQDDELVGGISLAVKF